MPDGSIPQVKITSCGLNGGPLEGKGEYPAYLACNLFTDTPSVYVGEGNFPRVMQDGRDGDEEVGYIANITDSTTIGFKYLTAMIFVKSVFGPGAMQMALLK